MATFTLDNYPIYDAVINMPEMGAWWADILVDAPGVELAVGSHTIAMPSQTLVGTITRVSSFRDRIKARMFGGKAKWGTVLAPKAYENVPARVVLQDIASAIGETLVFSGTDVQLPRWVQASLPASKCITAVMSMLDDLTVWRNNPDGSLFVGVDTWQTSPMVVQGVVDDNPVMRRTIVHCDELTLLPGTTLDLSKWDVESKRVRHVTYWATQDATRIEAWY